MTPVTMTPVTSCLKILVKVGKRTVFGSFFLLKFPLKLFKIDTVDCTNDIRLGQRLHVIKLRDGHLFSS